MRRHKLAENLTVAIVLAGASFYALARMDINDARTLPYQGVLEQGGAAANGDYLMRFGLFVASPTPNELQCVATDTCALWSEEQLVTVVNGRFSVLLGDSDGDLTDAVLGNNALFLGIAVKEASSPDAFSLLDGVQEIAPAPWAARAAAAKDFKVTGALTAGSVTAGDVTAGSVTTTGNIRNTAASGQLGISADKVLRDDEFNDGWVRLRTGTASATYADLAVGQMSVDTRLFANNIFGTHATRSQGTNYVAASDGFVNVVLRFTDSVTSLCGQYQYATGSIGGVVRAAGSVRPNCTNVDYANPYDSFLMPVSRGETWRVDITSNGGATPIITWVPLGQAS